MKKEVLLHYKTMRKCISCKEYITIEESWDTVIHYTGVSKSHSGVYHLECFIKKFDKNKFPKEDRTIKEITNDGSEELFKLVCKNHLYKYLADRYEIIMMPNYIYTKLEQIFSGDFRNMSKPIPPEHLLDMFIQRKDYLEKIYHKQKLDGTSMINYDLAVLIAKYPAYLKYIEKEKQNEIQTVSLIERKKIDFKSFQPKKEIEQLDLLEEELYD